MIARTVKALVISRLMTLQATSASHAKALARFPLIHLNANMTSMMNMTTNSQTAFNFDAHEAEKAAEDGMEKAKAKADSVDAKWSDRAYYHMWKYALNGKEFMTEDARKHLTESKLVPMPDNPKAWGGVARKLACAGLIERVDFGKTKNKKAHGTPATIWKIK